MPVTQHLTRTSQIERDWIESELFPACETFRAAKVIEPILLGKALYCLFYEPSFLTRTSFERAIGLLGGQFYHTEDASQFFPVTTPNYIDNILKNLASMLLDVVVLRSSDPGVIDRAEAADTLPLINGGSDDDHPTQALADLYTLKRELGGIDGLHIAIVGRLEHRHINALLQAVALYRNITITAVPFSGKINPAAVEYCQQRGVKIIEGTIEALSEADAVYLNGPRTVRHVQLLKARHAFNLRIDRKLMDTLKPHCVVLDPMQRSGDFEVDVQDKRLAFYRQAQNALYVRMGVLTSLMTGDSI